jgi:hypothetical protein
VILILLCIAGLAGAVVSAADEGREGDRSAYRILTSVIGAGGAPAASHSMRMNGTAAQPTPIGISTSHMGILYAGFWRSALMGPSGIEEIDDILRNGLYPSRPNPASGISWIPYSLAQEGSISLHVYDVTGRVVRTLIDGRVAAGNHYAVWDGRDDAGAPVASGLYFYRVAMGDFVSSRKMMLIR